ncbi:hypothetical protein PRIPAC_71968, partial [Pristionchus pacificus]
QMSYDSFAHDKCLDRCSVEIGGRRFDVSSTILASRSVYFYNCFMQPSFIESQTRFVDLSELEGITADDFHKFLRRAYVINEPIDGNSYQSLLKCADYFSSDQILKEAENFIIAHCCPEKWQANKKSDKKPFAINLITGIELSFKHHLENAKAHMEKMLGRLRFHTFLRDYPEVMQMESELRLWIFDYYSKKIIASQKV